MIRFKVIRASRILLLLAIALLVAVLAVIGVRAAMTRNPPSAGANLVQAAYGDEAETLSVFASGGVRESRAPDGFEVEVLSTSVSPAPVPARKLSVLIYHTHTHEAYDQVSDDPYDAVETWRTTDASHSVVRVGDVLAKSLEDEGFEVVHDVTDHEADELSTAYTRSLETLKGYEQPFDLYIDLHRDAWLTGMPIRFESEDGTAYAQPMLLIGNGNGFDEKPFYRENLAFARALTRKVNALQPGLCRDVLVKDGRYNQHIGVFSVLIEVGHNRNTLAEAINTAPVLARAILGVFDDPGPALKTIMTAGQAAN